MEAFKKEIVTGAAYSKVEKFEESILLIGYFPGSLMNTIDKPDLFSVLVFLLDPNPGKCSAVVIGPPDIK